VIVPITCDDVHPNVKDSIVFTPNYRQAEIVRSIARADARLRVSQAA